MARLGDYRNPEVAACHSVLIELMTVLGAFRDNVAVMWQTRHLDA